MKTNAFQSIAQVKVSELHSITKVYEYKEIEEYQYTKVANV